VNRHPQVELNPCTDQLVSALPHGALGMAHLLTKFIRLHLFMARQSS